jgi:hypothetical protein
MKKNHWRGRTIWLWATLATLSAPAPVRAQGDGAASAFARRLYDAYRTGAPDYLGRDARRTFAPPLLALILRDRASTPPGEVGLLDGDPICDCQDAGGLRLTHLAISAGGAGRTRARVSLRFPPAETRVLTLDLVAEQGEWRVADVHAPETPSLVRFLEQGLRRTRR